MRSAGESGAGIARWLVGGLLGARSAAEHAERPGDYELVGFLEGRRGVNGPSELEGDQSGGGIEAASPCSRVTSAQA